MGGVYVGMAAPVTTTTTCIEKTSTLLLYCAMFMPCHLCTLPCPGTKAVLSECPGYLPRGQYMFMLRYGSALHTLRETLVSEKPTRC